MMNPDKIVATRPWQKEWFWWMALSAALTAIYFTLVWFADDTGQLSMSMLFYFCVFSLLKEKASALTFRRDWPSYVVAIVLVAWVLLNSSTQTGDYTIRLFPFVSGIAIALFVSGWQNIRQYWRELTIFFFLGIPSFLAYHLIDISPLTAKFSTLMLWYAGFDIANQGTFMALADGRVVQVVYECSGIDMVNYLLGMAILCLFMFPIPGAFKNTFVPILGGLIGFLVNGFRVSLMVVLAKFDQNAFDNWHTGTGSYTFALLGVVMLGAVYWLLINQKESTVNELDYSFYQDLDSTLSQGEFEE